MKNVLIVSVLLLLFSCNKNPEINEVVSSKKVIAEIDKFIKDSNNKKTVKFMIVTGIENPKEKKLELLFTNDKPEIINENSESVNNEIKSHKYGYFTYNGYEFLVAQNLKNTFRLDYKDYDDVKDHFTIKDKFSTKEELMKVKWRRMYLKYDEAKDSVEFSSISEIPLPRPTY